MAPYIPQAHQGYNSWSSNGYHPVPSDAGVPFYPSPFAPTSSTMGDTPRPTKNTTGHARPNHHHHHHHHHYHHYHRPTHRKHALINQTSLPPPPSSLPPRPPGLPMKPQFTTPARNSSSKPPRNKRPNDNKNHRNPGQKRRRLSTEVDTHMTFVIKTAAPIPGSYVNGEISKPDSPASIKRSIKSVEEADEGEVDEGEIDEGEVDEGEVDEGVVDEGEIDEGEIDEDEVHKAEMPSPIAVPNSTQIPFTKTLGHRRSGSSTSINSSSRSSSHSRGHDRSYSDTTSSVYSHDSHESVDSRHHYTAARCHDADITKRHIPPHSPYKTFSKDTRRVRDNSGRIVNLWPAQGRATRVVVRNEDGKAEFLDEMELMLLGMEVPDKLEGSFEETLKGIEKDHKRQKSYLESKAKNDPTKFRIPKYTDRGFQKRDRGVFGRR